MNTTGLSIQDFLQIYQAANAQFDTFLTLIGIFITVFSVITAIVVAFFAIKQINVDREIRKYRDEIKQQKELAIQATKDIIIMLENTKKRAKEMEDEFKKVPIKPTKEELEKFRKNLEDLKEEVAFKRGALSTSSVLSIGGANTSVLGLDLLPPGYVRCKNEKCRFIYDATHYYQLSLLNPAMINTCPQCGHIN